MKPFPHSLSDWIESTLQQVEGTNSSRPVVTLSFAQSLDGSIAAHPGEPLALSGTVSMTMTHYLRSAHDAILIGIGTVLADNPQLTVRNVQGINPRPIIVDSALRTPPEARVFDQPPMPWIFTANPEKPRYAIYEKYGAEIFQSKHLDRGGIPLDWMLDKLGERGIRSLMVEGGAHIIQSFLSQGLADQIVLTIAPILVGGLKAVDQLLTNGFPQVPDPQIALVEKDVILWGALQ